jgi:tetratricopeptide (TPR) repeat protein
MQFTVPSAYVVKASGKEAGVRTEGPKTRYFFDVPAPTVLTFAAGKYMIKRIPGKLPVSLYLLKDRPNSQDYVEGCRRVVDVLQREFGPYPFPDFSIIETPSPISTDTGFSGASFEGFIFADSNSLDLPFNLAYFGHEIGHQWWGNLVQLEGIPGSYLLDEAMAQFGSLRTVEQIEGAKMAARYRFAGYEGYSDTQCGHGAVMFIAGGFDHPLAAMPANSGASHDFADAKGFLAWDAIAQAMGRDKFRKAIRKIAADYGWRSVTLDQFLNEIRAFGGPSVEPHIQQWLYRRGLPNLSLTWKQQGSNLTYTIEQHTEPYRLTIPVVVQCADGTSVRQTHAIDAARTNVLIGVKKHVTAVLLDPDFEILHTTPQLQEEAHAKRFLSKALVALVNGKSDEAQAAYEESLKNLPEVDPYAVEFETRLRLGGRARVAGKFEEARDHYEKALECPTRRPELVPWLYLRLAMVYEKLGDMDRRAWCIKNLKSADAAPGGSSGAILEAKRLKLLPP